MDLDGSGPRIERPKTGVVRAEGFEPPRLSSREPKSRASTSSATPASATTDLRCGRAARLISWPKHAAHDKNRRGRPPTPAKAPVFHQWLAASRHPCAQW